MCGPAHPSQVLLLLGFLFFVFFQFFFVAEGVLGGAPFPCTGACTHGVCTQAVLEYFSPRLDAAQEQQSDWTVEAVHSVLRQELQRWRYVHCSFNCMCRSTICIDTHTVHTTVVYVSRMRWGWQVPQMDVCFVCVLLVCACPLRGH